MASSSVSSPSMSPRDFAYIPSALYSSYNTILPADGGVLETKFNAEALLQGLGVSLEGEPPLKVQRVDVDEGPLMLVETGRPKGEVSPVSKLYFKTQGSRASSADSAGTRAARPCAQQIPTSFQEVHESLQELRKDSARTSAELVQSNARQERTEVDLASTKQVVERQQVMIAQLRKFAKKSAFAELRNGFEDVRLKYYLAVVSRYRQGFPSTFDLADVDWDKFKARASPEEVEAMAALGFTPRVMELVRKGEGSCHQDYCHRIHTLQKELLPASVMVIGDNMNNDMADVIALVTGIRPDV